MIIPEFVLRKLFVKGSLKKDGEGFSFCINNTFAPATLLSVGLDVDGKPVGIEHLSMGTAGGELKPAGMINSENSLPL